jgi:hypothetical protein
VGREIAGYHSTTAAIHMHEADRPDSLAEFSIAFRGTNFRESTVPPPNHPQPHPCKPESCFLRSAATKATAIYALEEFDGLLPLKKLVTFRNI